VYDGKSGEDRVKTTRWAAWDISGRKYTAKCIELRRFERYIPSGLTSSVKTEAETFHFVPN